MVWLLKKFVVVEVCQYSVMFILCILPEESVVPLNKGVLLLSNTLTLAFGRLLPSLSLTCTSKYHCTYMIESSVTLTVLFLKLVFRNVLLPPRSASIGPSAAPLILESIITLPDAFVILMPTVVLLIDTKFIIVLLDEF